MDILKLVEILDLDNLDDLTFGAYEELVAKPQLSQPKNLNLLKKFITKFTVRRTKSDINKKIEKEPERYINHLNKRCRFPDQKPHIYETCENEHDRKNCCSNW